MGPTNAPLFKLLSARMDWLSQRQSILALNIANADTPDYAPRDLRESEFHRLVEGHITQAARLSVARTSNDHLIGKSSATVGLDGSEQRRPFETSPDGNAVILEEQTAKVGQTALDHQLASNIYGKYLGMFRIALGSQGG